MMKIRTSSSVARRVGRIALLMTAVPLLVQGCSCNERLTDETTDCAYPRLSPDSLSGEPGDVVRTFVSVVNLNALPLDGTIYLDGSQNSLPVSVSPTQLGVISNQATVEVQIPEGTPEGRYTQTIGVSYSGVSDRCTNETQSMSFEVIVAAPTVTPSFTASVSPDSVSVEQGDSASLTVSVTRDGGFNGAISADVSGLPEGVTASLDAIDGAADEAELRVVASNSAAAGTSTLTLTLSGSGVEPQTLPIQLTVTERPDFDLELGTDSLTVYHGQSAGPVGVTILRKGGFSGDVTLEVEGLPDPVTASVTSPGAGDEGEIRFTAQQDTAKGEFELTIRASSSELGDKTESFTLTLLPPPALFLLADPFLSGAPGSAPSVVLDIERVSWQGEVELVVSEAPAGLTVTIDPAVTSGDSAEVTVGIGDVAPGTYEVSIAATGETGLTASIVLYITVTEPGQ